MDTKAVSANSVGEYFHVNGSQLSQHYKNHLSGYCDWAQLEHAEDWVLFPENIGERLCLDEVALSDGELYTILTNAGARCQKGSLIAMVKGVKSKDVIKVVSMIPLEQRSKVKEISVDMANNMEKIATTCFPSASVVTDRFHVAKLITEAVQEIRIAFRWEAIKEENALVKQAKKEGRKHSPATYENGDSKKQLLARSRYLLFKPEHKWSGSQKLRGKILFREFPEIKKAYGLSMMFRNIYETAYNREDAVKKFISWYKKVSKYNMDSFITAAQSIYSHRDTILNFFNYRTTNALAESFNSKIKAFRSVFRGVRDLGFFIYRVSLIFG